MSVLKNMGFKLQTAVKGSQKAAASLAANHKPASTAQIGLGKPMGKLNPNQPALPEWASKSWIA